MTLSHSPPLPTEEERAVKDLERAKANLDRATTIRESRREAWTEACQWQNEAVSLFVQAQKHLNDISRSKKP